MPLAYIDLDEYIEKVQHTLNDKENRRDDMMAKRKQNDKQLRKIAELDKQIDHDKNYLMQVKFVKLMDLF